MGVVSGAGGLGLTSGGSGTSLHSRTLPRQIYRFGSFELRTETGELSKRGIRLRLQAKPLQILGLLLARPGELVTREELCNRLWPETHVDFESGLNTAINRLRAALGDSADSPRYIETLPRLGYRLLCPVEVTDEPDPSVPGYASLSQAPVAQPPTEATNPPSSLPQEPALTSGARSRFWKPLRAAGAVAVIAAASLLTFGFLHSSTNTSHLQPRFHQLTFRSGKIVNARFSPERGKIVYTAKWRPGERMTYLMDLKDESSRALPFVPGTLEAISSRGELLFTSMNSMRANPASALSLVSAAGGSSRVVAKEAREADFDRSGQKLAIVRQSGTTSSIEFPAGHVIYRSTGWIDSVRVAPCDSIVAFLEHPVSDDDGGHVRIARLNGTSHLMTGEWSSIDGLAWAPSGDEIWFTASKAGGPRNLYAVSEKGSLRRISNSPLALRILDLSSSGRALVSLDDYRVTMMAALPGSPAETDLSKFDFSFVEDISSDGKLILFTEGGAGGGQHYTAFVYNQETHETVRIGAGRGVALSPDRKSVLTIDPEDRSALLLMPVGSGQSRRIPGEGFQYQWARFAGRGGDKLLVGGSYSGGPAMIATQPLSGGKPVNLGRLPYMDHVAVSRDGLRLAGLTPNGEAIAAELANEKLLDRLSRSVSLPVAWSADGRSLYTLASSGAGEVIRTDLQTGKTEPWKSFGPKDVSGFIGLANVVAVPELGAYAYSPAWDLSRLYVVDGWT
jgi:DNA-binding winged helix-turn-helix (wHTH) protein